MIDHLKWKLSLWHNSLLAWQHQRHQKKLARLATTIRVRQRLSEALELLQKEYAEMAERILVNLKAIETVTMIDGYGRVYKTVNPDDIITRLSPDGTALLIQHNGDTAHSYTETYADEFDQKEDNGTQ